MANDFAIVVPWHRQEEIDSFRKAWSIPDQEPDWLITQHDADREGCAVTKNRGIARALVRGAQVVVVLDGDCYPGHEGQTLESLALAHIEALAAQPVTLFDSVTSPVSRGTPYLPQNREMIFPVAASMGFWDEIGDYCAVRQLVNTEPHGTRSMMYARRTIYGRYFPLCGMNLAFRAADWMPWCSFINVDRFDDIWMGWLWQREATRRGYCFHLGAPGTNVRHSRQSNVWANLRAEAKYLEENDTLWRKIAMNNGSDYETLRALLPA